MNADGEPPYLVLDILVRLFLFGVTVEPEIVQRVIGLHGEIFSWLEKLDC